MSAGSGNVLLRFMAVLSLAALLTLLVILPAVYVTPSEVTAHNEMTFRLGDILSGEYRCAHDEERGLVLVVSNRSALVDWAEALLDGESPAHAAERAGSGLIYDTEGAMGSFEFRLSDESFMVGLFNPGEGNVTVAVDLLVSSEPEYICLCFVAPMAVMVIVAIWAMGRGKKATGPGGRDHSGDEWLTRYGMADARYPKAPQEERQKRRGQREEGHEHRGRQGQLEWDEEQSGRSGQQVGYDARRDERGWDEEDDERHGGRGRWEEGDEGREGHGRREEYEGGRRGRQAEGPGGDHRRPPHVPAPTDDHGRSQHMPPPPDEQGRPQYMPPPPDSFYPCLRCGERLVPDGWGGWYCPRCDARY
jgi:hypothetical protein